MSIYLATFGKLRYLGLAEMENGIEEGAAAFFRSRWALLRTMRGLEMGLIGGQLTPEQETRYRKICSGEGNEERSRGPEPMLQEVQFVQDADQEQIETWYQCRADEERVLLLAREILLAHDLKMKLVDVEYMLDRKKLFFYFTSEQRVDFRAYVRDLAREFRTRIEMRQIGVRDEARVVKGVSPCGRPCCCSYWLHQFSPICIRMVKEQKLALNPTKISGICGRLMCCMAYEQPVYEELWKDLPGPGAKIRTEQGIYVLDGVNLATESVEVRFPSGNLVPVSIAEFPDFRDAVLRGEAWGEEEAPTKPATPAPLERPQREKRPERPAPRVGRGKGRREGNRTAERQPFQDKVTLDEHLARRQQMEAFENRESVRRGPGREGKRRPPRRPHSRNR